MRPCRKVSRAAFRAAGSPTGGELLDRIRAYYELAAGAGVAQVALRVPAFFMETAWPFPYDIELASFDDYAFDVQAKLRIPSPESSVGKEPLLFTSSGWAVGLRAGRAMYARL